MTSPDLARRGLAAALLACLVLAVTACGGTAPAPSSQGGAGAAVPALPLEVNVQGAADMRAAGAFVLDVRQPEEWAAGHIPDATLIPLGELADRVAEVPTDRQIVVVCRSGNRSQQGRDILLNAGYGSVTSMIGGMNDWTSAGLPVVTGQ
jgi:rhodanese-related sulfurtransferase